MARARVRVRVRARARARVRVRVARRESSSRASSLRLYTTHCRVSSSHTLPALRCLIASGVLSAPRVTCTQPRIVPATGSAIAPATPMPTPLTKPFTPSSRAPMTGAATNPIAPATTPFMMVFAPEAMPALTSFGRRVENKAALSRSSVSSSEPSLGASPPAGLGAPSCTTRVLTGSAAGAGTPSSSAILLQSSGRLCARLITARLEVCRAQGAKPRDVFGRIRIRSDSSGVRVLFTARSFAVLLVAVYILLLLLPAALLLEVGLVFVRGNQLIVLEFEQLQRRAALERPEPARQLVVT